MAITIDKLPGAIAKILDKYGDDVQGNLTKIVQSVTRKGARTVKSEAGGAVGGSGKYAAGWKSQVETSRFNIEGTIYNAKLPGLPHLLEHGHALRGGGRTAPRVHIAPVEQELIREFESQVKSKL